MLIWGIHAHVGIRHEDRVWPLIHALMTCHPHMLALSSSSPGWNGLDTGYASNRTMLYQQLPTAGLPPQIHSWEEWSSYMKDQSRSGVINHTGSMHLDIRPAGKWGTVELRVCDSVSSTIELAALSAFMHCLVVYFDEKIDVVNSSRRCSRGMWRKINGVPHATGWTRLSSKTVTQMRFW